jgi:hypothetical protein
MAEQPDIRSGAGDLVRDALLTLLFAVIAVVSAVTLAKTLTKPFATGSLSVVQWALFVVTAVGATLAFVRSIRSYASLSLLRRLRRKREEETADTPAAEPSEPRMHPVADHLSWGAITLCDRGDQRAHRVGDRGDARGAVSATRTRRPAGWCGSSPCSLPR